MPAEELGAPEQEYLLVTEETLQRLRGRAELPVPFESGSNRHDELSEIAYGHHALTGYLD